MSVQPPKPGQAISGRPLQDEESTAPHAGANPHHEAKNKQRVAAHLIELSGDRIGNIHALVEPSATIGRGRQAAIDLRDLRISRAHAALLLRGSAWQLTDLGSKNGSFINGVRIDVPTDLADGDVIGIGEVSQLRFSTSSSADEADVIRARMVQLGKRDPKTNTLGLEVFHERIYAELSFAQRHKLPRSLLLLDVIAFNNINIRFGLPVGDEVLARIAGTLRLLLRSEDFLCRWVDDKFLVLCRSTSGEQALGLSERLQQRLQAERFTPSAIPLQIAIGIAAVPDERHAIAETFFLGALDALTTAKEAVASGIYLR
jgi:diguanylate cyclase (GGDEF)-like protein